MESLLEQYSDAVERLRMLSEDIPLWAQVLGLFLLTVVFTAYPMYLLALRRANRGRSDQPPSKETLRSKESTLAMLSRFVARGLNDDQYFAAEINPEHPNANEVLRMNPLKPDASGSGVARIQATQSQEKRLAFCIGCDSAATPHAHEDAERMQRFFDDLGYKTVLLTSKTMTPSTTALALWALQVKHSERVFDTIVVFVAGKLRLVELSRQAFVQEEASTQKSAEKPNEATPVRPGVLYLVELLVNERQSTDVKSWVDIHMFAQRLLEATSRQSTDLVLMVDAQYSVEDSQFLLSAPATPEEGEAAAYVKQLTFEQILSQAAVIRHQPISTLGCMRVLPESAVATRKTKYLGSLFVKKLVEAKSKIKDQGLDPDTEADAEVVQVSTPDAGSEQAFPTAYGNCRTGLYHCGAMTTESITVHLRTAWEATKEDAKPGSAPTQPGTDAKGQEQANSTYRPQPPFWSANLQRSTLLHSQDALMPRMASPYPVDSWLAGGCHTADLQKLRTLLLDTSKQRCDAAHVPRCGLVLEVQGTSRGVGLSSFLRRFAWGSGEIRRDILYFDLESYSLRPPARGAAPKWSFARLVAHLGRTYSNLEHQIPDESSASEFAKHVLSKIPSTLILDHYSPGAGSPAFDQWLQYLASASDAPSTRLWVVLGASDGGEGAPASDRNAQLVIGADPAFSVKGFLASPARRGPSWGERLSFGALEADPQMSMWHWVLLRGLQREPPSSTLQSAASVAAAAYGSLLGIEKDLVDYLFRFGKHASSFGCGSLSTTALAAQALDGVISMWDATQHLRDLSDRGIIEFITSLEPCSPKEVLLSHVRLNWALVQHLTASRSTNDEGVAALATRIVEQYGKHATDKTLRVTHDGFFLPRIVCALRLSDAPVETLSQVMKVPPLAASDGTFPVMMRFLAEAMRTRGVTPTIEAFRTISQRSAQHPLGELPEPILSALESHSTALQTQLNELPQVVLHAVQSSPDSEERCAPNFLPGGFWSMPLVRYAFYQNPLQPEKDAPLRAPAVCAICLQKHSGADADDGTLTAVAFVDAGKDSILLGFSNGVVALAHLSPDAAGKFPALLSLTKLEAARLSGPVDTIIRHGADRWVTASRAKHEIVVWGDDFTTAERVEQLSRPQTAVPSSEDEAEKDEEEDASAKNVRCMKRALHVHLLTRAMSQYHYDVYLRGAADADGQGQPASGREASQVCSPPSIYHVALVSVGRRAGSRHPKQPLNDTTAPEHEVFNHVTTNGFDFYRGLATISTPNDRVTTTAAGVGACSDGTARVVVGLSTGDVLVYGLRCLPRGWQ